MLIYVFTYSIFIDPDCKLLRNVGWCHLSTDIISTLLIINNTDCQSSLVISSRSCSEHCWSGLRLEPRCHSSKLSGSGISLLPVVLPASIVLWRPKLEFGDLEESPTRIGSNDQSYIFLPLLCKKWNYQGFEPTGHTQFQEICDKLFLCCLATRGFNEAGFPQAWKNLALQLDECESFLPKIKALWNAQ